MNFFRHFNLRCILSTLLLFALLFSQIQLLYACDSMEGKPKYDCCCGEHSSAVCPMAVGCAMNEHSEKTICCEVSYDMLNDAGMISSVTTADVLTLLLNSPQPPPDIGVESNILTSLPILTRLSPVVIDASLLFNCNKDIYLFTRRLRL